MKTVNALTTRQIGELLHRLGRKDMGRPYPFLYRLWTIRDRLSDAWADRILKHL